MGEIQPTTKQSRRFVRYSLGFGVGVGVGLAPLLGAVAIPGFQALLSLFPWTLVDFLIPLSSFMMGTMAVVVQYRSGSRRIVAATYERAFKRTLGVIVVSLLLLVVLYFATVARLPIDGGRDTIAVVTGVARVPTCACPDDYSRLQCLEEITLRPAAVESCWGSAQVAVSSAVLSLLYLFLMGGFGALIGIMMLRPQRKGAV